MKVINRYTLRECFEFAVGEPVPLYSIYEAQSFTTTCAELGYPTGLMADKETKINECFKNYLYPIMYNEGFLDVEDAELDTEYVKDAFGKLLYSFLRGYDKYSKIIDIYETKKDDLVDNNDALVNETIAKYNDTPQSEGNYEADNYTTSINKATETRDNMQKKSNLDKIIMLQQKLENTYQMWANELFNKYVLL